MTNIIIGLCIGLVVGGGAVFGLLQLISGNTLKRAKEQAEQIKQQGSSEALSKAKEIELTAAAEQLKLRQQIERASEQDRRRLEEQEQRILKREELFDRKIDTLNVKERTLDDMDKKLVRRTKELDERDRELSQLLVDERNRLQEISGLSADQAKEMLLHRLEDDCAAECSEIVRRTVEHTQEEAKEKSRQIILTAIQRYAAEQTSDHTVSSVAIPDDAMKGRVIGREGRNIRSFEKATGVDVIIDDTPGVVVVSCFDPVRREIARISLEKLVIDGRIHPARIEEIVVQVTKEMEEELLKIGKDAAVEANLPNLPKPILPMLGRLHYRTSYGQNVLKHSLEVAYLCQVMAAELGLDANLARRAGFLHDIGKAMDHEQEGGHPLIGKEFLKKFNEAEAVLNAAEGHHGDVPPTTVYTPLVMAADAISASRPGARRESLERYVKRLQDLEQVAMQFEGVRQAYAIQAGREIRVIVDAKMIDDKISAKVARDIAKKIESELTYPGEIKVTLIREVRSVEYAR